ncbi:hypothetical protein HXX76_001231 [Chlamydomonas incerta]|uniref:Uncharacterized protein n=1 Tax=Chlamydomonas incerta TaxID=51695 RepID=A0A835WBU7_CHLIN|nr:hypothetical protein HXX76_001231 [Chlamydomonas incerta]|eukprot:KAG2444481.1 hypothetical protein HXX76_001231 [Chlamydomonas incerta]
MTAAAPKAKKLKKVAKPVLESPPADGNHPGMSPFARALGSTDFQTREKGLQALAHFLTRKSELKQADMMKIWKGLFYCFWHSDKQPVQAELAQRLAAMLTRLNEQTAYLYFTCFLDTMRREWFGIDRLRLDKFLMLIRRFVHQMLLCLKAAKWRQELVVRYTAYLQAQVVLPDDTVPAVGLAYHLNDVLLDELRGAAGGEAVPAAALEALLAPFAAALAAGEQAMLNRISEGLFDSLLAELAAPTDDSRYLAQLDVAALAAALFEMGAEQSTRARNRQVLYDLSNSLERLQRKRQRVDTGAEAGPSSKAAAGAAAAAAPAGKMTKKQQRAAAAAEAARAAEEEAHHANGVAAAGGGKKGKQHKVPLDAVALHELHEHQHHEQEEAAKHAHEHEQQHKKAAATPATGKKAGGKKGGRGEVAGEEDGEQVASGSAAPTPVGKGGKAQIREPTSGQKAALRAVLAGMGNGAEPASAAKSNKKGAKAAAARAAEDGEGPAAAVTPAAAAGKTSALGKRGAPGSNTATPAANGAAEQKTPAAGATTAKKKGVVINLKKNLYFEHGGPVPEPDIRTPPPLRAKGGILKKGSVMQHAKTCPPKGSAAAAAATRGAPGSAGAKGSGGRVLPKQARRASAALFF